jgi:hypothetical protein
MEEEAEEAEEEEGQLGRRRRRRRRATGFNLHSPTAVVDERHVAVAQVHVHAVAVPLQVAGASHAHERALLLCGGVEVVQGCERGEAMYTWKGEMKGRVA